MLRKSLLLPILLTIASCSLLAPSQPVYLPPEPPPSLEPPYACAGDFAKRSEVLTLPATLAPKAEQDSKSAPLRFANTLPVNQLLDHVARLTPFDNGWSSYALRIRSAGATSLSVHLSALQLPAGSEVWLCSADGSLRQGPYRDAPTGELWTPVINGDEAWLEVLVHSRKRDEFQATLADVSGGFR
jgi:lysyl endopeptidase